MLNTPIIYVIPGNKLVPRYRVLWYTGSFGCIW